jgi:transcriptional regulator with XRE-family HTH domain
MNIQELCRIRKEELKLTYHDISDASGVPLSTVQNFFSKMSKAPSIYTVAPICKGLGISLDEIFGISEHLTPTEETLQARNDELERHVDAKADTIEIMRRCVGRFCALYKVVNLERRLAACIRLLEIHSRRGRIPQRHSGVRRDEIASRLLLAAYPLHAALCDGVLLHWLRHRLLHGLHLWLLHLPHLH